MKKLTLWAKIRAFIERQITRAGNFFEGDELTFLDVEDQITPRDLAGAVITINRSGERESLSAKEFLERHESAEDQRRRGVEKELEYQDTRKIDNSVNVAGLAGGRASLENESDFRTNGQIGEFISMAREDYDVFRLSEQFVRSIKPNKLLEILSDASPELSRALFDFLLMACPGWSIKAVGTKSKTQDDAATDFLKNEVIERLKENYHAPEVIFVKHFLSAFLRGSICSEAVFDARGREFVDIAIIDPDSLTHKKIKDERRGLIWGIYQRQGSQLVDLNIPSVGYIPIHAFLNSNRGRPLAKPAIFVCFFLIATLQDLRRVIRQQGYPRIDIQINIEKLRGMIPEAQRRDLAGIKKFSDQLIAEVRAVYSKLKPDDVYIHSDAVTLNQPVGALNSSSLGVVGELLKALERMATRALKTQPLMMATNEGVSEANANRQWEIYVAGIKSIQHYTEAILDSHFDLALRAKGFQAKSELRFSELRAAELLRDSQVELLQTTIARQQYDNGSITADEMAQKSTQGKKDKADQQEPREVKQSANNVRIPADNNPQPGDNRSITDIVIASILPQFASGLRATAADIANASKLVKDYAPTEVSDLLSAQTLED